MENRRRTYRHAFSPHEALRVELVPPDQRAPLACTLVDLSLGGMRIRLPAGSPPPAVASRLTARLVGRDAPAPVALGLTVAIDVCHLERHNGEVHCGVQFLSSASRVEADTRERSLTRFLMLEQLRASRHVDSA